MPSAHPPKSHPQCEDAPKLGRKPDLEWHRCGVRWWHRPPWACTYIRVYVRGPWRTRTAAGTRSDPRCAVYNKRRTGSWRLSALWQVLAGLSHSGPRLFLRYVCGAVPFSIAVAPRDRHRGSWQIWQWQSLHSARTTLRSRPIMSYRYRKCSATGH